MIGKRTACMCSRWMMLRPSFAFINDAQPLAVNERNKAIASERIINTVSPSSKKQILRTGMKFCS
jgi:hypothetical protein